MFFLYSSSFLLDFYFLMSKSLDIFILNINKYILFVYTYNFWFFLNNQFIILKFFDANTYLFFYNRMCAFFKQYCVFYFCKLRLKGLGFRIRQFSPYLFRFFFTRVNFFYLHVPFGVSLKYKGRILYFISVSYMILREMIVNILLLNRFTVYRIRGFIFPQQVILMKPGKKRF